MSRLDVFEIGATYDYRGDAAAPQSIGASMRFPTLAAAREFAARFPKSIRLRATTLSTADGAFGLVKFDATLTPDGVNEGVNETGLKRYRSFRRHLERLEVPVEWKAGFSNSYRTEADFEAAIAERERQLAALAAQPLYVSGQGEGLKVRDRVIAYRGVGGYENVTGEIAALLIGAPDPQSPNGAPAAEVQLDAGQRVAGLVTFATARLCLETPERLHAIATAIRDEDALRADALNLRGIELELAGGPSNEALSELFDAALAIRKDLAADTLAPTALRTKAEYLVNAIRGQIARRADARPRAYSTYAPADVLDADQAQRALEGR